MNSSKLLNLNRAFYELSNKVLQVLTKEQIVSGEKLNSDIFKTKINSDVL